MVCTKSATRSTRHHRVGHELPRSVVGHPAAAIRLAHLDAALSIPVLAGGKIAGLAAPALGVYRRVFEHEQQIGNLVGPAPLAQALLKRQAVPVGERGKLGDPELGHVHKATDPGV